MQPPSRRLRHPRRLGTFVWSASGQVGRPRRQPRDGWAGGQARRVGVPLQPLDPGGEGGGAVGGEPVVAPVIDNGLVRGWIGFWLSGWRSEPVEFVSPLPVPEVRAVLREGSTSYLRSALSYGGAGGYRVLGRVGERRVTLEAGRAGVRNSWRPVLHARLEAAGTGSRLTGRLGWSPVVKAISGGWLAVVCGVFVG